MVALQTAGNNRWQEATKQGRKVRDGSSSPAGGHKVSGERWLQGNTEGFGGGGSGDKGLISRAINTRDRHSSMASL